MKPSRAGGGSAAGGEGEGPRGVWSVHVARKARKGSDAQRWPGHGLSGASEVRGRRGRRTDGRTEGAGRRRGTGRAAAKRPRAAGTSGARLAPRGTGQSGRERGRVRGPAHPEGRAGELRGGVRAGVRISAGS